MAPKPPHKKPSTVGKELKKLRESARPPLPVREMAMLLELDAHTTYAYYEDGYKKQFLPMGLVLKIADVLAGRGVERADVLALGGMNENPKLRTIALKSDDDFTPIGRFDASFSMGPGSLIAEHPEPMGYWMIETQWLHALSKAAADDLAIVRVAGDSMQPTLFDGDWVLVDRTQTRLSREGIYAIRVADDAWVKRISLNIKSKKIRVLSDNLTTPAQPDVDEEDLAIIGRVIALVARKVV